MTKEVLELLIESNKEAPRFGWGREDLEEWFNQVKKVIINTDKISQLIEDSDMNQMQKNSHLGFIFRAKENEDKRTEVQDLIEKVYGKCTLESIPIITDDFIVFKVIGRKDDDWDVRYPYRGIFFKNDKWSRIHTVCSSVDEFLLIYLGEKYLGCNSPFADFAMKMLEMNKIEE